MINRSIKTSILAVAFFVCTAYSFAQTETFSPGSFIINMGATNPNTVANGLKPYGLIYDLIRNYQCPIKWIINQNKVKDGVDFFHSGVAYRGGTFIIPKEFRTAAVNARIAFWQGKGVQGVTTVSSLTLDVYRTLLSVPKWTLDKKHGNLAERFLKNADITNSSFPGAYNYKYPKDLAPCDDLFIMPHPHPEWKKHGNLYNWNRLHLGSLWASNHALSDLENMVNPANPAERTNFLSTNGLKDYRDQKKGTPPYINRLPNDPVAQYLGPVDKATNDGATHIYIPDTATSSVWRPTTKVIVYDPTQKNVPVVAPDLSNSAAVMLYGRGFGNSNYGWVTYIAGNDQDKTTGDGIAAQRSFFNFSFFQVIEKSPVLPPIDPLSVSQPVSNGTPVNLSIGNATSPVFGTTFTYQWMSSAGGAFTPSSGTGQNVTWMPPVVSFATTCVLSCVVTDNCGRVTIQSISIKLAGPPALPVPQADSTVIMPLCGGSLSVTENVLTNDSDLDGRPLTLNNVSGAINGSVSFTASGDVTYTPNSGFFGVETLTYQVCNNASLCANGTYKITVGDPALIPAAANDAFTMVEDNIGRFDVLANDGASLTVMGIPIQPTKGKVSINIDNTISYLPIVDFSGIDSFTYKVTNASGYNNQAKVTITVTTDGCSGGTYETVAAYSGTTTFNPLYDTYMDIGSTSRNFGTCATLLIDGESNRMFRSLIKFDLTSAAPLTGSPIPAAATTITSSTLSMVATIAQNNNSHAINIHRVTTPWIEGTICNLNNDAGSNGPTWNNSNFTTAWGTPGGDFNAGIEATTNVSTAGTYSWGITNMTQNWWTNPSSNLGMLMKFNLENLSNQVKTFGSKENGTLSNRPVLSVNWYVPHVCSPIPARAPFAMPDSATTPNGVLVNIATAANDYYPGAGTKTYSIITAPSSGTATINSSTGVIAYTPSTTFNGVRSMTYEVLNTTTGLRDTAFVYVEITNGPIVASNDAPVGDSSDVIQTINVKMNDTDPETAVLNNTYQVTIATDPKNGSVTVDANGSIIYTPNAGFSGMDTLYYVITEPAPSCGEPFFDTAMVVLTVFNKPPEANGDLKNILPCQTITFGIADNDTDPENGVLTVTNVSALNPLGAGTVINNNDGTVTFTPATGFLGAVTFTYTVTDNGVAPLESSPATVTINVATGPNNPPVAVNDSDTTYMDQFSVINVLNNDSDPDNDNLDDPTITVPPLHGTASVLPGGLINYIPNPGFFGADTLTYRLCDLVNNPATCTQAPGLCVTAKVFLYVVAPNTTVAVNDENSTWVNTPVNGSVMFNDFDPEGEGQTFTGFKDTSGILKTSGIITVKGTDINGNDVSNGGTITISAGGKYLFTPALNFSGVAYAPYSITDNADDGATDSAYLKITVNYFPKIMNSIIAHNDEYITYGNVISGNALANDKDPQGDLLTVTSFRYDTNADGISDATGIVDVAYTIAGFTTSGLPVASAGSLIVNASGEFTFTPAADFHGSAEVLYTVCDDWTTQACASNTLKILILPDINGNQNDPPVSGDDFNVTTMNTSVNGNFIANDYDPKGDPIAMNGITLNPSGAQTPIGTPVATAFGGTVQYYSNGTYTYTPAPGFIGPDSIGYQICDVTFVSPQPLCSSAFLHFLVSGFNTVLAVNDVNNTWLNMQVRGNILTNDQDPENNTLTLTGIRDASNNIQPVITSGTTVSIAGKDKNGTAVANAGSLNIKTDGSYTYTPANDFTGVAVTKYSVCDNGTPQVCKEVDIVITVNTVPLTNGTTGTPGNNITIANDDSKGTIVNETVSGNVLTNDNDPEGNSHSFQSFLNQNGNGIPIATGSTISGKDTSGNTVPSAGIITFTNAGNYTFTPTPGFTGSVAVPYKVCDNGSPVACEVSILTISIVPNINRSANKRPVGSDDFNLVNNFLNPGSFASGNVLSNDIDPGSGNNVNGTALSVQNTGSFATEYGTVAISSNGNYIYIPNSSYTGPDRFIYTVCDNGSPALCSKATIYFLNIQSPAVLPINLLNFGGSLLNNTNLLNWATANEINSDRFEIESRTDVSMFTKIGSVTAKGITNTRNIYNFIHQNPGPGVNYYRLKIFDKNQKFSYSNIVALKRSNSTVVKNVVYPNPFRDKIELALTFDVAGFVNININDASGRLIRKERKQVVKGDNLVTITGLKNIAQGIYFLVIKEGTTVIKEKLIKIN